MMHKTDGKRAEAECLALNYVEFVPLGGHCRSPGTRDQVGPESEKIGDDQVASFFNSEEEDNEITHTPLVCHANVHRLSHGSARRE